MLSIETNLMVLNNFALIVAALAIAYALIVFKVQNALIDKKFIAGIQAESKELSNEFDKAKKANDKKRMEEITAKQLEVLPKMNKMMFGQLKVMAVVLVIFFAFTWALSEIDPTTKDDITIMLKDDGRDCDAFATDGIFSACYQPLANSTQGKWVIYAKGLDNGAETGKNATYIMYGQVIDPTDTYVDGPQGEPVVILTDKREYAAGEQIKITAISAKSKDIAATLNMGSSFYVDLPVTIPILNLKRVHYAYWWFLTISILANLTLSFTLNKTAKPTDAKGKKDATNKPADAA